MLSYSWVIGRHAHQKRQRIKEELLLLLFPLLRLNLIFASASCSKSAFKQDFTKNKKGYPADLLTKNQKTVGNVKFQKFSSGTCIIRIKSSCMKKLTLKLN